MDVAYILKWSAGSAPRHQWFVRGIKPDQSFWGDVTIVDNAGVGRQANISGKLSVSDYDRMVFLATEIEAAATSDNPEIPWQGLLAKGPLNNPQIIFRYRGGKDRASSAFLEIIAILDPLVSQFY